MPARCRHADDGFADARHRQLGVRPRHAAPEAGDGRRPAGCRANRGHDRRRCQRRAGAQGRRRRRRHGLRIGRHPLGRPAGAAGQPLRRPARGRRRGAQGDRQHRAGRQAVPHQDRVRGVDGGHRRHRPAAVPLPPPPPHAGDGADDRRPGLRAGAGTEPRPRGPQHGRPRPALQHPGGCGGMDLLARQLPRGARSTRRRRSNRTARRPRLPCSSSVSARSSP